MCDFAADAQAAEQLLVGRVLTVKRVRELNAKDYFYQMLKDNPEMLKIYPGIENELLQGAIDCHIHAFPDFVHRSQDIIQIAIDASKAGMRALAFKDHWNISANAAYLTQRHIDYLMQNGELTHRVEIYGGAGTCFGINPEAIRVATAVSELQDDLVPDLHFLRLLAWRRPSGEGQGPPGRRNLGQGVARSDRSDGNGGGQARRHRLRPHRLRGTAAARASWRRRSACAPRSIIRCSSSTSCLLDEMKQLADLGIYVGTYCQPMIPSLYQPVADPMETISTIKAIGAERCIIGSDFGQVLHMDSIDGMRVFIRALLAFGIKESEVKVMLQDNPAKLMYLDE